ncbi:MULTISPECIES: DnaD domain protein [unclassified Clostridium]|uniref:DnaD domain protein n=1 Tax=unclassified Clostridium TaxID=2614128 RepID=UPI0009B15C52|nr:MULTISPECIES: DnaD domain protein [unclassified Clostridium]
MAEKRMFSKTIIDSDAFLDMPLSTQVLYFHLSMRADDDGFINNPKKIQRMIGCGDDDLRLLIAKKFVILFESGVIVIKHWKIHNYIQNDRYKETMYREEKSMLSVEKNKAYTLCPPMDTNCIQNVNGLDTICIQDETTFKNENKLKTSENQGSEECIQTVYNMDTQIRLDKTRLEKNSIDKNRLDKDRLDKDSKSSIVVSNVEVFKHFEKCGFMVTPMLMEKISADIEVYGSQWLIDAATEALERGKINNYKYVIGIIQNWQTEGRDTKQGNKVSNSKNKPLRFNNFEARDYDYDSLEKKLLGWEDNDNEHG